MNPLESRIGNFITLQGKSYSYFAGNDYLGLAARPETTLAAVKAVRQFGTGFSASRQTTGTSGIHIELEQLLADFKGQEAAMVFASGYLGSRLLLETLADRFDTIFADSMAHPSILDGIPRGFTGVHHYNHCDTGHLEQLLNDCGSHMPLIITDGIFALTGEIAPLDQIHFLAEKYHGLMVVDDAHATGVLGANGRGTPEYFNLGGSPLIYQSETMSKALGSYGGFISGTNAFIDNIRSRSPFYSASTALPPAVVGAACASLGILKENPQLRSSLLGNARKLRAGIREAGFSTSGDHTPIIPLYFRNMPSAQHLSAWLEEHLIIAPAVSYPVKTGQFIVRITVSATHTSAQLDHLMRALKEWRDKHGRNNH